MENFRLEKLEFYLKNDCNCFIVDRDICDKRVKEILVKKINGYYIFAAGEREFLIIDKCKMNFTERVRDLFINKKYELREDFNFLRKLAKGVECDIHTRKCAEFKKL